MATEPLNSDPLDPLSGIYGPSLFPRTFRASTDVPVPSDPMDLDSIHHFMKSVHLFSYTSVVDEKGARSPEKLLNEAKMIVDGGSKLLNSNFATFAVSLGTNEADLMKENVKPQERRPGLGRKRAHFSLKPKSSQPPVSLVTSLDIDQLQDPEQFFSQFEKLENAQKEIERQNGGSAFALNENKLSQNPRRKRPGILGKSVTYKHHYASVVSETEETLISSRELMEPSVISASNSDLHQETNDSDVEIPEYDSDGSISETENKVDQILDELLMNNSEDLDGDGALSLLQEQLHIKPFKLNTLSIPDFRDIGKIDFVVSGTTLPKPQRSSFVVGNLGERTSREATQNQEQMEVSPCGSLALPTPSKSPCGSLSLLKRRIMQSNPLRDPFSPLDVDLSTPRNSQPDEGKSPTAANVALEKETTSCSLADLSMGTSSSRQKSHVDVRPDSSLDNIVVHHESNKIDENMDDRSTGKAGNDDSMEGPDLAKENVEDAPGQVISFAERLESIVFDSTKSVTDNNRSSQMKENVKDVASADFSAQVDFSNDESVIPQNMDQRLFDESLSASVKDCTSEMLSTTQEKISELETENEPHKRKKPPVGRRERKNLSHRPSIADAGTTFDTGVRRSKRIKMRPLEYWKGERKLYARVNESIKLIGLKYISPSKSDENLKVKSFISPDKNELVELAAKH